MIGKGVFNLNESENKRIEIDDDIFMNLKYYDDDKQIEIAFETKNYKSLEFPSEISILCISTEADFRRYYTPDVYDDIVTIPSPDNFTIEYKRKIILEFVSEVRYGIMGLPNIEVETA